MFRLLLLMCTLLMMACPRTVEIEAPSLSAIDQDLGSFQLSTTAKNFVPYQTINTLVFLTEDSTFYNFIMTSPQYVDNVSFQDTYANPDNPDQNVYYRYSSDIQRFTFTNSELGALFQIEVRSNVCGDPQLMTEDIVFDFLLIRGLGFNSGDITIAQPGVQFDINRNTFCGDGQRIGQFSALGKTFTDAYAQSIDIGSTGFLRVFFNQTDGIIAFEIPGIFAVLDHKF